MELPAASGGESIKVFVRVRPSDPSLESNLDRSVCLDVTSQSSLTVHCKPEPKVFTFDHVAAMDTTQEDVFTSVGRPIIDSCMCGYNGTIFAYGQTGSGKTFTMIGPSDDSNTFTHELRGIIPRSFEYLFSLINREKQKFGDLVEFLCKCSFLEIYNEQVYDLIDPVSSGLHLRENMQHGVYVDGLLETCVASAREAYGVLSTGWSNRRVAATSMNRESSRSHAVFTLTIESKKRERKDSVAKLKTAVLNLVDLAGSERQRDTHTVGVRLKEAGSINKSLSALGNVIMALVDIAHGKSRHVHYRDSKLTFLLRDSLGGNAKTNLVANVHPNAKCFGESLSTLNFARRAKMIKNKAVINEDATGNVLQLQAEIRRLRERLEKFKTGTGEIPLAVSTSPIPSMEYSSMAGRRSDDDKTIHELREMLSSSMSGRDKADKAQEVLLERVENLQKLCKQKDSFLQSTKMILKFRETHIANIEKTKHSETPVDSNQDAAVGLLKQEIEQLRYMVDHHPDVSKSTREIFDLKAELKRLQTESSGGQNLSKELARTHKYTLQLEKQLRHFLVKDSSPTLKRSSSSQSKTAQLEVENLQTRCKQLQNELDKARKSLISEREAFHGQESKLVASLTATKKSNLELERSIEALKLKNSVEKATLNDVHMNTIKSMLTPRKDLLQRRVSLSSTPYGIRRADSEPLKNKLLSLSFDRALDTHPKPATIVESPDQFDKKHAMSSPVANPRLLAFHETGHVHSLDKIETFNGLPSTPRCNKEVVADDEDELNIEGALTDELKILQDKNRHLQQQIEDLEKKVFRLTQDKTSLEVQLEELTRLHHSEMDAAQARESGYLEKMADLASQVATLTSSNTVSQSEVVDLRICLRSADKEIVELKSDMKEHKHSLEIKFMEHMQRIGELEQCVSIQAADWDRHTEELQSLQDEVETLREELTFKDHRISELEQSVVKEREQGGAMESEVQVLLDKLACEAEKNMRLSCELQEGSQGKEELVAIVSENSKLKSEVESLENELRSQLTEYKHELKEAEMNINSLMNRRSSDEATIADFMSTIQELRGGLMSSEAQALSLGKEVEDSNQELSTAVLRIDQLSFEVVSLKSQLGQQASRHERHQKKNAAEHEVILDDLDRLDEQYQQLQEAFSTQTKCLKEVQSEEESLREELASRDAELAKLYQHQRERRESLTRTLPSDKDMAYTVEEQAEEIDELKGKLEQAADMISMYEIGREDKNKELQAMKEELESVKHFKEEKEQLRAQLTTLQYKLSFMEDHLQRTEEDCQKQLQEGSTRVGQLEKDSLLAVQMKDKVAIENADLQSKCQGQGNSIDALTQQIVRYKTHEETIFREKESLRSQLEAIYEEQSKLSKECEKLTKENAAITGHQNIRQKIQYHATVKIENSKLKEEVIQLRGRLKIKNNQVAQLQQLLTEKEIQPPIDTTSKNTVSTRKVISSQKNFRDSELAVKENISPF